MSFVGLFMFDWAIFNFLRYLRVPRGEARMIKKHANKIIKLDIMIKIYGIGGVDGINGCPLRR